MAKEKIVTEELKRQCVVCGADLTIVLYSNHHYHGGHYFGKMELIPGEEVEYWECENCYRDDGDQLIIK